MKNTMKIKSWKRREFLSWACLSLISISWAFKARRRLVAFPFRADGRVRKMKRENQFRALDRRSRNSELEGGSQQNTDPTICHGSCHFSS
ncbi:hypothetical protein CEXT_283021 [Caerostris extrusa]|uniref:Secreted protein n=1 Tax=Caerostris extrusa TaxID=172846 RepID=A0AAV4QZP7_CAEEX|nr:hypothetical protein CEXT_283021 [Caerostris extrusa]